MIATVNFGRSIFGRAVEEGVLRHAAEHDLERWGTLVGIQPEMVELGALPRYRLDGLIAALNSVPILRHIQKAGIPCVNVSGTFEKTGVPSVLLDNAAIGRMAADYFLARGYRHFACVPISHVPHYAVQRGVAFTQAVRAADYAVSWFVEPGVRVPEGVVPTGRTLTAWLRALPKPVAVFTTQDRVANEVYRVAMAAGIGVPDQISILGVDNESHLHFGTLGISSIETPLQALGQAAAALLDRLLDGEPPPASPIRLPPTRVVTRSSSDTLAVDDPLVLQALRFIRERAPAGIGVEDVVQAVPLSRRSLQRRFSAMLGSTVSREILHVRLQLARRLLMQTRMNVQEITEACGFGDRNQFFVAFRASTGQSPSRYRATSSAGREAEPLV